MSTTGFQLKKTTFRIQGTYKPGDYARNIEEECRLFVDGHELSLADSLKVRNHSPDGWNWGYGGSGPAQSALAICLHIFGNRHVAEVLYQRFKEQFVARWQPQRAPFAVTIDLTDFLIDHREWIQQAALREAEEDEWKSWELVEEAEHLLNPVADEGAGQETLRAAPVPARSVASRYKLGDVVRVKAQFCDSPANSRAVVYELYEGGGISLITEGGDDLGGFSLEDQADYVELLYHVDGFAYEFRSCSYLMRDWRAGVFSGVFR